MRRVRSDITLEDIRKNQIIDASIKVISERGTRDVTLDDIAKAAEMSKGGVSYYFSSKEELFVETFREFFDRIFQRGWETMNQIADPLEKILSFEWFFNLKDPDVYMGYRILFDGIGLAPFNENYNNLLKNWVESWIDVLRNILEIGVKQGQFKIKDIGTATKTIVSTYLGAGISWYLIGEIESNQWAIESIRNSITSLIVDND